MARSPIEHFLTKHELLTYQRRLSSYLKDFGYSNKLQDKEIAEKIGLSPQKFYYLKSDEKIYSKFANSVDYLSKLGNLQKLTFSDFAKYLEGHLEEGKVYSWQKTLLESFEVLTSKEREIFVDLCKSSLREGKEKLQALIELVNVLRHKDLETIKSLRDALKKLS